MEIKNLKLDYFKKSGFTSSSCDGVCHIKTLPTLSVVQATEGSYDIKLGNGETYNTGEGGFFIAPKDILQTITHHVNEKTGNFTGRWIFIKAKANDIYCLENIFEFPVILPEEHRQQMNFLFDKLFNDCDIFLENVYSFMILKILHSISQEKSSKVPNYINNTIEFIKENYKEKLTAKDIATKANLSKSYFFTSFKKVVGVSPITFLNNFRLSLAEEMLINTDKSINEIADSVGIEDPAYFNKAFRKAYQISPLKYRKKYKKLV